MSADIGKDGDATAPAAEARQGAVTGVIKPPVGLRMLVDKTAEHVALRGKAFEDNIKVKMKGKPKFDFLNLGHPYHRYYLEKVDELSLKQHLDATKKDQESKQASTTSASSSSSTSPDAGTANKVANSESADDDADKNSGESKREEEEEQQDAEESTGKATSSKDTKNSNVIQRSAKLDATAKAIRKRRTRAPPPLQFTVDHPIGTEPAQTIDLIKLMAKYAAVLGDDFIQQVRAREQYNPEFGFLHVGDRLHSYFREMRKMYAKVLAWEETMNVVAEDFKDRLNVLDRAVHRVEWESDQAMRDREMKVKEREEFIAFNQIDWHDFALVDTISFEDKPSTSAPSALADTGENKGNASSSGTAPAGKGPAAAPAAAAAESDSDSDVDMDMDDSDEEDGPINVRENYQPQAKAQATKETKLALPDGREMSANDVNEHMRVELLDPKWKEQRERFLDKQKVQAFAEQDIGRNLKRIAAHRPDVFSTDAGAVERARKEDEAAAQSQGLTWDGTASSAAVVTAEAAKRKLEARNQPKKNKPEIDYKVGPTAGPPSKRSKKP